MPKYSAEAKGFHYLAFGLLKFYSKYLAFGKNHVKILITLFDP